MRRLASNRLLLVEESTALLLLLLKLELAEPEFKVVVFSEPQPAHRTAAEIRYGKKER